MQDIRSLSVFGKSCEKPTVHRFLELIYRSLPLIQLGPSMCELIFEKFHQVSKHAVLRSNGHNSTDCSMNYWRDVELISRAVSQPEKHGLCRSWFLNQNGSLMKAVIQHRLAAGVFAAAEKAIVWRAGRQIHGQAPESM